MSKMTRVSAGAKSPAAFRNSRALRALPSQDIDANRNLAGQWSHSQGQPKLRLDSTTSPNKTLRWLARLEVTNAIPAVLVTSLPSDFVVTESIGLHRCAGDFAGRFGPSLIRQGVPAV